MWDATQWACMNSHIIIIIELFWNFHMTWGQKNHTGYSYIPIIQLCIPRNKFSFIWIFLYILGLYNLEYTLQYEAFSWGTNDQETNILKASHIWRTFHVLSLAISNSVNIQLIFYFRSFSTIRPPIHSSIYPTTHWYMHLTNSYQIPTVSQDRSF